MKEGTIRAEPLRLGSLPVEALAWSPDGETMASGTQDGTVWLHRAEDGCDCRKPKPGLLRQALTHNPGHDPRRCWMAGDGITDVQAGQALGLRGALSPARGVGGGL